MTHLLAVALCARPNAGKETAGDILLTEAAACGFSVGRVRFSDPLGKSLDLLNIPREKGLCLTSPEGFLVLEEMLRTWYLEVSDKNIAKLHGAITKWYGDTPELIVKGRDTYQRMPQCMREAFGLDILSRTVVRNALALGVDFTILDGARWTTDEEVVLKLPRGLVLGIDADEEICVLRDQARARHGEKKSREELLALWRQPNELEIQGIVRRTPYRIENNFASKAQFEKAVRAYFHSALLPLIQKHKREDDLSD